MKLFSPPKNSHKGQNGKLLIIGGSKKYHGAPKFSILAARRFVDLIYFYPAEKDPDLISEVKKIPEVIVIDKVELLERISSCDCVLFGIGLDKAIPNGSALLKAIIKKSKKLVIDGDGLKRIKNKIPKGSIITPHEAEFEMLFGIEGTKENVQKMAKSNNFIILKKGPVDSISNGKKTLENKIHNQGMTKGGTGDVLSGLVAALACKNDNFASAYQGARICGRAGNLCKKEFGYNFSASDLADKLAIAAKRKGANK